MIYFAYGSNLFPEQMQERCPGSVFLGSARLDGWRFGYFRLSRRWAPGGAADIIIDSQSSVWGSLWHMKSWQEMDAAEGVHLGAYKRIKVKVWQKDKLIPCQTYTACEKHQEMCPRKDYWQRVIQGARATRLPDEWVAFLENHYALLQKR